jgi:hypothetical protein
MLKKHIPKIPDPIVRIKFLLACDFVHHLEQLFFQNARRSNARPTIILVSRDEKSITGVRDQKQNGSGVKLKQFRQHEALAASYFIAKFIRFSVKKRKFSSPRIDLTKFSVFGL